MAARREIAGNFFFDMVGLAIAASVSPLSSQKLSPMRGLAKPADFSMGVGPTVALPRQLIYDTLCDLQPATGEDWSSRIGPGLVDFGGPWISLAGQRRLLAIPQKLGRQATYVAPTVGRVDHHRLSHLLGPIGDQCPQRQTPRLAL